MSLNNKIKAYLINIYYNFKCFILRLKGAKVGKGVRIYGKIIVKYPKNLIIGNYTTINDGVLLNCKGGIEIGNYCRISSSAQLHSTGLTLESIPRYHISKKIVIDDNVWVCSSSVITKGVHIERNSVISGLSLVIKDVDQDSVYCGVPAKKIKSLEIDTK